MPAKEKNQTALQKAASAAVQKAVEKEKDKKKEQAQAAPELAAQGPPLKKPRVEEQVVPTQRVASTSSSSAAGSVLVPQLPEEKGRARSGTREFMKTCVPWVNAEMPKFLKDKNVIDSGAPMPDHGPVVIEGNAKKACKSFKESWNPTNCVTAVQDTGFYEAGGNATWLNPEVVEQHIPSEDPPLTWVMEYGGFEPEVPKGTSKPIIRFPTAMEGVANRVPPVPEKGEELGRLGVEVLPLAGHMYLYAWYYQAWLALTKGDLERVRLLYQCALTTTISLRVSTDKQEIAEASSKFSERIRAEQKVLVDNFVTFSGKLMLIAGSSKPDLKDLVEKQIRYNSGLINQTMLRCAVQLQSVHDETKTLIAQLDREYGKEVLSGSYNKLRNLLYGCCTGAKRDLIDADLVDWSVRCLLMTLRRKEAEPEDFKVDTFSKSRDGTPSWIMVSHAQRGIVLHLWTLVSGLKSVNQPLSEQLETEVMQHFQSYDAYDMTFPAEACRSAGEQDGSAGDEEVDPGEMYMNKLQEKLPKGGLLLAEILRKVYDGSYDEPLAEVANSQNPSELLATLPADQLGQLGKDLRELMRALHASESVVPSSAGGIPKASLRDLVRQKSDGGDDAENSAATQLEREDVWKRATAQRKKFATLLHVKDKKLNSLHEAYKKCGGVRVFKGVLNESHRAFVVSGDLLQESAKEPWRQVSVPVEKDFGDILKFMKEQRGDTDIVMAFDGLSRSGRRFLEDSIGEMPSAAEIALTYAKAPNAWCMRRNFFGSRNMEVGYVVMPINRTKITVKERQDDHSFNGAGEDSTHYTTYTGIPHLQRSRLALIANAEKDIILGGSGPDYSQLPEVWRKKGLQGVPLYWMETKSQEAWERILQDTSAKAVVDLSAGSGVLACACMNLGVLYVGFVYHKTHLQWLTNVIDRASMKYLTESGSSLYQEDLATHVKQVFVDLVEPGEEVEEEEEEEHQLE